ncbi:hypothetical protein [Gilliamella sp. Occ4-3]|uniref:hypothetical protein n=1 Tax=Gilliamella sp. Occ4-3 TaxID=3120254 RepID=UPI00080DF49D|nr:hypothetical protein [Gilliamella apicola]OCG77955.1 hypothetical protein A9G44_03250 [Gilliamella apicola]
MFIPIWVIVIIALLVISLVFFLILITFSKINKTNELMKKLDNRLEKISSNLKLYAEKVSSEPKSFDKPEFNEDKVFTVLLTYVRDINACVVFFTLTVSAALFFLLKQDGLKDNVFNNIIQTISFIVGYIPTLALLFKLINNGAKIRGCGVFAFFIIVFLVTLLVFSLSIFSLHKVVPDVIRLFNT